MKKGELRPGIGLCDMCGEPRFPQEDQGYGIMLCLDCAENNTEHMSKDQLCLALKNKGIDPEKYLSRMNELIERYLKDEKEIEASDAVRGKG